MDEELESEEALEEEPANEAILGSELDQSDQDERPDHHNAESELSRGPHRLDPFCAMLGAKALHPDKIANKSSIFSSTAPKRSILSYLIV